MPEFRIEYFDEAEDETPSRDPETVTLDDENAAVDYAKQGMMETEKKAVITYRLDSGETNTRVVGPT